MMRKIILLTLVLAASSGCVSHLRPYKMDIRQGNYITPEMRDKLKLGMSKQQVRYVMGTPLVSDVFHGNRWDYTYSLAQRGTVVEKQLMTLYFDGDSLARIDENGQSQIASAPVAVSAVAAVSEVVAAPVAASAVPAPVVAANAVDNSEAAVQASVQAWAKAWAARDTGRYLASYADTFQPEGMSHAAWQALRGKRLASAKLISVALSDEVVALQDNTHATVQFKQTYRSDSYHDVTRKILRLERSADKWLIVSELTDK